MGVAGHLGIQLAEYDARIRTFIPNYDEMLAAAAGALRGRERSILDLGVGTGALSARCLQRSPRARLVGVDLDPDMLPAAARRLGPRASLVPGSFLRLALPPADAVVASLALHHVRTLPAKRRLFARVHRALHRGGRFISADCYPAADPSVAAAQRLAWMEHLRRSYSATQARKFLRAWSVEDLYVPLSVEAGLLQAAGFRVDVIWRAGVFAVLLGSKRL